MSDPLKSRDEWIGAALNGALDDAEARETKGRKAMAKDNGSQSTALVPVAAPQSLGLEPRDVGEALTMAAKLVASGFLPKSINKPEAAFAIILAGRELGLPAMQSLRSIHIIEGKPVLSADLMVALCKRSPVCAVFRLVESTDKIARYEAARVGEDKPTAMAWTIEQATAAGLAGKDNWKRHPSAMLRARCASALARAVFPDLLVGCYSEDEGEEIRASRRRPIEAVAVEVDESVSQAEPTVEEVVATYRAQIEAAESDAALSSVAKEIKAQYPDAAHPVRAQLRALVTARQALLREPPTRQPGEDG